MSVEQQINLKFLVRLGKTPTEALKLLQEVYGDDIQHVREKLWSDHRLTVRMIADELEMNSKRV